ncbi:type II secretion system protein GspD [Pseudomonas solani]|uniref:Type II secretion system protein GspD n=2 Tax=Pseudomonas solani TaxID=2731552 RepID=A0ABN6BWG4_9PSED|nr:type II secretion system protein GspD [Pseudomonas solani]
MLRITPVSLPRRLAACGPLLALCACLTLPSLHCEAAPTAAAAPSAESAGEARWTINLRDADIADFTEQVASISGQTLVLDPRVKGRVTVLSESPLTLSEVYQLFLSVMSTHGYTVVAQGNQARVVPDIEGRSVANSPAGSGPETFETRLIQVQQTPVNELLPMIRPLVPQNGHLAAIPSSNALIVSDKHANIERLMALIGQLDRAGAEDSAFYDLQHAWAKDVAAMLQESLRRGQAAGNGNAQVIADPRTNRLLLLGPPEARERLLRMAKQLDTAPIRAANTRVVRLRHGDAKDLAKTLGELSEQLRGATSPTTTQAPVLIRADEGLNALILMAEPDMVGQLEELVQQLDVPRAQVLVEAAIVEMSGDVSEALGVQWAIDGRSDGSPIGGTNFSNTGLSVGTLLGAIEAKTPISLPDGAIVGIGNDNFGALITALSASGHSNLLSTPSLLTLDNQQAEILVGQNVPFQTGSYTTDAAGSNNPFTTIERKDVGVTLKVTPHINEGGTLRLVIEQEISSIAPSTGAASRAVDLVTNKRMIKSTVLADNGQVIVLGGLIQDDVTRSESKVPLLGDIPLLGGLFRSSKDVNVKRNLMVFLRPRVVRDGPRLADLSQEKYQDLRQLAGQDSQRALPQQPLQLFQPAAQQGPVATPPPRPAPAPAPAPTPAAAPEAAAVRAYAAPTESPIQPVAASVAPPAPAPAAAAPAPKPAPAPAVAQRFSINLIEGSSEQYMRALMARHPGEPLRIQRTQRDGRDWYRMFYGDYPQAELAERALHNLPASLPSHRGQVTAL